MAISRAGRSRPRHRRRRRHPMLDAMPARVRVVASVVLAGAAVAVLVLVH